MFDAHFSAVLDTVFHSNTVALCFSVLFTIHNEMYDVFLTTEAALLSFFGSCDSLLMLLRGFIPTVAADRSDPSLRSPPITAHTQPHFERPQAIGALAG